MTNREHDSNVLLEVAVMFLLVSYLFYLELYIAVLVVVYVGLLADIYNRTSFGCKIRNKLRATFRRNSSNT